MLSSFLLAGCGLSQPGSMPLISQLQHALENAQPTHAQRYGQGRGRALQAGEIMTEANTAPLRLHVDFASLYEATAPPYSACFATGNWFRRGLPTETEPPANGVETCVRGDGETTGSSFTSGCWGRCLAGDVITAAGRQAVIDTVTPIAIEVGSYFSVVPTVGNMTFEVGRGAYARALETRGYTVQPACAVDCTVLSSVAVDPSYCSRGVRSTDAILSITKPPGVQGIAGTGSSCAADQNGRPLWLVFAWHSSLIPMESRSVAANIADNRGLVLHEIVHGLGFLNSAFNYARDAYGNRKNLLQLTLVTDQDGATDEVWHFTKGRAFEMAQLYFGCDANRTSGAGAAWHGLPLMGLPETGRASHWETRIMRDDVMSYGFKELMSSITLAAMEDLGHYLANYSNAECMHWGLLQGCGYVKSRCGLASHDQSAEASLRSECYGDSFWSSYNDPYLSSKCETGHNPCSSNAKSGFALSASSATGQVCDAQCFTGESTSALCKAAPGGALESTNVLKNLLENFNWQAWLVPACWLLGLISVVGLVRRVVCPYTRTAYKIASFMAALMALFASCVLFVAAYAWQNFEVFEAFVGRTTLIGTFGAGCGFLLFSLGMLVSLYHSQKCTGMLLLGYYLLLLLTLVEVLATLLVAYWIYTLGGIPNDQISSVLGDSQQHIDTWLSEFLGQPIAVASGTVCVTYTSCCKDPKLGVIDAAVGADPFGNQSMSLANLTAHAGGGHTHTHGHESVGHHNATCYSAAQGLGNDLMLAANDPSQPYFCEDRTGAPRGVLVRPPLGACLALEYVAGKAAFSLDQCRADFCQQGTDGYLSFVELIVSLFQRYAYPMSAAFAALVLVQLIFACNLKHARTLGTKDRRATIAMQQQQKPAPGGRGWRGGGNQRGGDLQVDRL